MEFNKFYDLARSLMNKHGLQSWGLTTDNAKKRFGQCRISRRELSFSWQLVHLNTEEIVRDTILHEIAHALVPSWVHHGREWQQKAISIGCNGKRCYNHSEVVLPKSKYTATCPKCGAVNQYSRIKNVSCGLCSRHYNPELKLVFKLN